MSDIPPPVSNPAVHSQNANLLNSAQLLHDGYSSGSQLPTNLDGGTTHNPGCKNPEAILTFSWAIKRGVRGLRGDDLSRTQPECHVHTTSVLHEVCAICGSMAHTLEAYPDSPKNVFEVGVENFGATSLRGETVSVPLPSARRGNTPNEHWVTVLPKKLPSSHRKRRILPTPSRFSAPKVAAVRTEAAPTIFFWGGTSGPSKGLNLEHNKHSSSLDKGLNPLSTFIPYQDSDLPIDEDDEMDIFLNLEGDNEPQHSSDSSKKRRPGMDSAQGLFRFVSSPVSSYPVTAPIGKHDLYWDFSQQVGDVKTVVGLSRGARPSGWIHVY
ncbi:LOW QUALITY PROTEIN: hypothetical protein Cgig2_010037 [Carnegiea gigantea]|uniref:Uncharacterized protein n=1 Tax=Carnegiea gigantea TaxID=171969 RepID=A0A9Q1JHF0_9CARY|nr:LOW QUALITY PROTEIN: hypothetical protein Cgig2_010037 [Carnegiea gigantea]